MPVSAGTLLSFRAILRDLLTCLLEGKLPSTPSPRRWGNGLLTDTLDPQMMNDDLFCHYLLIRSVNAHIAWTLPPFLVPPFLPVSLRLQHGLQI